MKQGDKALNSSGQGSKNGAVDIEHGGKQGWGFTTTYKELPFQVKGFLHIENLQLPLCNT
jgi:hypothetical protein